MIGSFTASKMRLAAAMAPIWARVTLVFAA
jgi:hypothetical protein